MMPHGLCACYRWWKPLADAAVELVGDLADDVPEANDENASAAANTSHGAKSHASRKQAKLLSHEQPFIKAVLHAAALAKVGSLRPINSFTLLSSFLAEPTDSLNTVQCDTSGNMNPGCC